MNDQSEMRVRLTIRNQSVNKAARAEGYGNLGSHEQRFPPWITRVGAVLANKGDPVDDERTGKLRLLRLEAETRLKGGEK